MDKIIEGLKEILEKIRSKSFVSRVIYFLIIEFFVQSGHSVPPAISSSFLYSLLNSSQFSKEQSEFVKKLDTDSCADTERGRIINIRIKKFIYTY